MKKVKKHFDDVASGFDTRILKSVPFYMDMLEVLVLALPFNRNQKIKIADLGCGTGTISKMIKEHYPDALITCVDFAGNMVQVAKNKLKGYGGINYVICDCRNFDFSPGYDAILSSLTLHHIRDNNEKRVFYKKIFKGLNNNGVFYAADLILGSSDYLQNLNLEKWNEFLLKSLSQEEILKRKKIYEEEDHPFRLMDELSWLKDAGFCNVDVIWKYYFFTVYGGQKG
ncbi:MAG: methyltransferase domain-containing protein [Candidatus Omnitrophota bacterium]